MRLQRETWFILLVTLALSFVAINIQAGWLYILVFSVAAILLCGAILGRLWTSGKIQIERFAPAVFEGERIDVLVRMTNLSSWNKYLLFLEDRLPFKNSATSAFLFFPSVPKGRAVEGRYQVIADRRGVYLVNFMTLYSGGPSGFFQWHRRMKCRGMTTVYPVPRTFPFSREEPMGSSTPGEKGIHVGRGGEDEFFGIREYEPSDSPKGIHWPSSAKAGKLMVREMSRSYPALISFFLDCDRLWSGESFEEMVRLATYAIEKSLEEGNWVRLFRGGEILQRDRWGNLEALASFEAESPLALPEQIKSRLPKLLAEKQIFFFTATPPSFDPDGWEILKIFPQSSVRIHLVVLNPGKRLEVQEQMSRWLELRGISFTFVGGAQKE